MQQSDRAGLLYVLAGFSMLSVGDAVIKSMAHLWPATAISATRFGLAAVALVAMVGARQGWGAVWRMPRPGLQWSRGLVLGISSVAMFTALGLMPLAEATTITFTQPMITALLAAGFLGERLRPAAIGATLIAFAGVVLVLRPNVAAIGLPAFLPLLAAIMMALLMIANRASAGVASAWAMQAYIAVTAAVLLIGAAIVGHLSGLEVFRIEWPAWHVLVRCAVTAVTATIGHWLIFLGTARAGAATVAPMTYGQLIAAGLLGWAFFGEVPDALALLGAAIIVGSGLYLWLINRMPDPPEPTP